MYEIQDGSPLLDTHIKFGHLDEEHLECLGVLLPVQFGQVCGPIERLVLIIFRNESRDLAEIEGDNGIEQIFDCLQLGSGCIEAEHFGGQGFELTGGRGAQTMRVRVTLVNIGLYRF